MIVNILIININHFLLFFRAYISCIFPLAGFFSLMLTNNLGSNFLVSLLFLCTNCTPMLFIFLFSTITSSILMTLLYFYPKFRGIFFNYSIIWSCSNFYFILFLIFFFNSANLVSGFYFFFIFIVFTTYLLVFFVVLACFDEIYTGASLSDD